MVGNAPFPSNHPALPLLLSILIFIPFPHTFSSPSPILYDIYPFIRVYTNGTVQRFIGLHVLPPSPSPFAAVRSRDVPIPPSSFSVRFYFPNHPPVSANQKLPLLIYFHGGGFFAESAVSPTYHNHLNLLASTARVLAVSVNYRLAPEHPLPTAYEDAWRALQWSFLHASGNGSDPWLTRHADFRRVYLGGDSAGANIAHRLSVLVGSSDRVPGVRVVGMFLNCPYFMGRRAIAGESAPEYAYVAEQMRKLWRYGYPNSTDGLDDPLVNPEMDSGVNRVECRRVLVYVAGNDWLRYRGWYYKKVLDRSGWVGEVKVVEVKGEDHVFNLIKPTSPNAVSMLKALANFLNAP